MYTRCPKMGICVLGRDLRSVSMVIVQPWQTRVQKFSKYSYIVSLLNFFFTWGLQNEQEQSPFFGTPCMCMSDCWVCDWEPDVRRIRNLPVAVSEQEIEEMFSIADTDQDQRISYQVGPASLSGILRYSSPNNFNFNRYLTLTSKTSHSFQQTLVNIITYYCTWKFLILFMKWK